MCIRRSQNSEVRIQKLIEEDSSGDYGGSVNGAGCEGTSGKVRKRGSFYFFVTSSAVGLKLATVMTI
jgi:hypothetical protein